MANWNNPLLTSTYTNFLAEVKARDEDLAKQFDGQTVSNLIVGAIRWDSVANRWKKWDGSSWVELTGTYALTGLSTTGAVSVGTTLGVTGQTTLATATATTPATADNNTNIATTAFVKAQGYALLASPGLTGTPTAPTAALSTNTTQIATTAFVNAEIANDAPTKTGGGASGTWAIAISGNAATATNLSTGQGNWNANGTISAAVGLLAWKNYGNNHVIFDASAGTSPSGGAVNVTNASVAWSSTYPTLMGWNGTSTYGVRVDSARVADSAGSITGFNNPSTSATANTIVYRDGLGDIAAREIILSSGLSTTTPTVLVSMFPTTNQLVRTTPAAVAAAIQGAASGSWAINITGSAASATTATNAGNLTGTSTANVSTSALATGTANSTTFLRGDRTWQAALTEGNVITDRSASGSLNGVIAVDYTSIPSWVKKITLMLSGVSTTSSSVPMAQLGTSSGLTTSGYLGTISNQSGSSMANYSIGVSLATSISTSDVLHGIWTFCRLDPLAGANVWTVQGTTSMSNGTSVRYGSGSVTLPGVLNRIRFTTFGGTSPFDAGNVNILLEG